MAQFLSNIKYAELLGITKSGVGQAVKSKLIVKGKAGIDPEHPVNVVYAARLEKRRKGNGNRKKTAKKNAAKKKDKRVKTIEPTSDTSSYDLDDKKKLEETRLKRIQADKAALEYAERLKILVDDKTLRRKFGIFYDHILNDLIYMPDSIAEILVNAVKTADDPVNEVTNILKKTLKVIIRKGKRAARKVRPPKKDRRYVIKKVS